MFSSHTGRLPLRIRNKNHNGQVETCFPKAKAPPHMSVKMPLLFSNISEKVRQWLYLRNTKKS